MAANYAIDVIRNIPGLEEYIPARSNDSALSYVKISNGSFALKTSIPLGTIINSKTEQVYANFIKDQEKSEDFKFIILYHYKDWTIWDKEAKQKVKFTIDRKKWNDGTMVDAKDLEFQGKVPPLAQEAINFIIMTTKDFTDSQKGQEPVFTVLSFQKGEYKTGKDFLEFIIDKAMELQCPLNQMAFSLHTIIKGKDDDKTRAGWAAITPSTFVQRVKEENRSKLGEYYQKVKADVQGRGNVLLATSVVDEAPEQLASAVTVEEEIPVVSFDEENPF